MNKQIFAILFFVSSAVAKGDNWNAPPSLKTYFSFQLIWAALSLVQFVWILKNLRKIPSMAARGPYILLAIITSLLFLYFLLAAIWTRIPEKFGFLALLQYSNGILVASSIATAFQPAVALWLLHQRGTLLMASKGNTISPFTSQIWKQIVDWVLVGITLVIYIASIANRAVYYNAVNSGPLRDSEKYVPAIKALGHTTVALSVVLAINVVVSAIALRVQGKRAQWNDLVTARVCQIVVPVFLVYAIQTLVFDIYYAMVPVTMANQDARVAANIADLIIDGICRIAITSGLIITMSLPGVQWTPARGEPLYPGSHGLWPDSKSEESQAHSTPHQQPAPLYPQQSYTQ